MTNDSSNATYPNNSPKLSGGAVAGIVVGVVVAVSLSGFFLYWKIRRRTATTRQNDHTGSTSHLQVNNQPESYPLQNITPEPPPPSYHERELSVRQSDQDQHSLAPTSGSSSPERDTQRSKHGNTDVEDFGACTASGSGQNAPRSEIPSTSAASPVRPSFDAPQEVPNIEAFQGRAIDHISAQLSGNQRTVTDRRQ